MILNELFTTVDEGIEDPDILKALMLIGGPGSGKTTVGEHLISGTGIRSVNTDAFYEMIKTRNWLADNPGKTRADMPGWDIPQDIRSDPDWNTSTTSQYKRLELLVQGRLGIMLDMTGQKAESTQQYRQELEQLGYDVAMLYVRTPVEVAQQRNATRRRRVDPDTLVNIHTAVNTNATYYKIMFGNKMVILDNHRQPVHQLLASTEDFHCAQGAISLSRWFRRWLKQPVNNSAALHWKRTQLQSLGRRVSEDINKKSSSAPVRGGTKVIASNELTEKQLLALAKRLNTDCAGYIQAFKKSHQPLYRGMADVGKVAIGRGYQKRRPLDSDIDETQLFDQALTQLGIAAQRGNSIFTSGDIQQANSYGHIYVIVPKDTATFSWSKRVDDLTLHHGDLADNGVIYWPASVYKLIKKEKNQVRNQIDTEQTSIKRNKLTEYQDALDRLAGYLDGNYQSEIQGVMIWIRRYMPKSVVAQNSGAILNPELNIQQFQKAYGMSDKNLGAAIKGQGEILVRGEYYAMTRDIWDTLIVRKLI